MMGAEGAIILVEEPQGAALPDLQEEVVEVSGKVLELLVFLTLKSGPQPRIHPFLVVAEEDKALVQTNDYFVSGQVVRPTQHC
mmetsp:Transcript_16080/g.21131  ORF Transcript_16080/g.21131 Transcript_16080/m.21131 type:complete len:83 (-) Transcript_16080:1474-1722(-)